MAATSASFLKINRHNKELRKLLAQAPIYQKIVRVRARPALVGETIRTILRDGFIETVNIAFPGDWVITNPLGEKYTVSEASFQGRYEKTKDPSIFQAKGYALAVQNPFAQNISLQTVFGEDQRGSAECFLAIGCNPIGYIGDRLPYLIDYNAFLKTYQLSKKSY